MAAWSIGSRCSSRIGLITLLVGQAAALRIPALRPAAAARRRSPPPCALSPSGIDGLPLTEQAEVVASIMVALGVGSVAATAAFEAVGESLPAGLGTSAVKASSLLGGVFMAAGYAHFALPMAYEVIFPPPGTWGLWYLPGSASFHVAWTGVAECLGGAGLLAGGALDALGVSLGDRARPLRQLSASALFVLMIAVFPANIYQYTHGATMAGAGPDGPLPLEYHYARLAAQVLLLSALSLLSRGRDCDRVEAEEGAA